MGCLFGCFRLKENGEGRRNHLVPSSIPSTNKDSLVSKRQLGSFFLDDEKNSPPEKGASPSAKNSVNNDSLYRELKHEAEFLKACGALLQTPAEIRKTSRTVTTQAPDEDGVSSSYVPRLPGTSCEKILWDEKHELSRCPVQVHKSAGISQSKCESCIIEDHQTPQHCECSLPSVSLSKSLSFEGVQNESVVEPMDNRTPDISLSKHESQIQPFASKYSPFATPLRLTDEMETPATVYPANLENVRTGRNTKIRSQYVYPVLNPLKNLSQWKVLNEDSSEPLQSYDNFDQKTDHSPAAGEKMQQISLMSEPEDSELSGIPRLICPSDKRKQKDEVVYTDKYVSGKTLSRLEMPPDSRDKKLLSSTYPDQVVTSLSQWLKSPIAKDRLHNEINEKSCLGKSSDVDRPILGMVAAHWKDEEPECKSSKSWDGNGIPNSTNKYKEDQKVSWHATPFEERLEKALSDEKFLPQRKILYGKPIKLDDEGELSDTAAS